jgi:hypothetical protein
MAEVANSLPAPDFYIAAMGRSGSTMLCNWLSSPPGRIVFNEPFLLRKSNSRLLRIQLANLGMPVSDSDWAERPETLLDRCRRLLGPRLEGRRWAAKEVLCEEHRAMTRAFAPPRVLVSVRDIGEVASSFFDKHRLQDNLDRFGDDWVVEYCLRESSGLLAYLRLLEKAGTPFRIVRYEDFTASPDERGRVADFTGWPGGGDVAANLYAFDRGFEVERHGGVVTEKRRGPPGRGLPEDCLRRSAELRERCHAYQRRFGYA